MKMIQEKKEKILMFSFAAGIFVFFFLFFTVVHPMYVYDMDDWSYIHLRRKGLPEWKSWNPTRVLPETLMPLTAELGIRLFMPLGISYLDSIAIAFAVVTSLFFAVYFYGLCFQAPGKSGGNAGSRVMLGLLMLLVHFLPYSTGEAGNAYMYAAGSVTLVFFYTIPALLNAALVFYLSSGELVRKQDGSMLMAKPKIKHGWLLLLLYLAINSNMFQNILLMAYIASELFFLLLEEYKVRKGRGWQTFLLFCKKKALWIAVLFVWFLSLFLESQGGRAKGTAMPGSFGQAVVFSAKTCWNRFAGLNRYFLLILVSLTGMSIFLLLLSRKKRSELDKDYIRLVKRYLLGGLLTVLYLILLCARTSVGYMTRADVFSGILFYLVMFMAASICYCLKKIPPAIHFVPLSIFVLLFLTLVNRRSYCDVTADRAEVVKRIGEDIVEQVLEADQEGKEAVEILVPVYPDNEGNWPLVTGLLPDGQGSAGGERVAQSLYIHGLTDKLMVVTFQKSEEMNQKYHLYEEKK